MDHSVYAMHIWLLGASLPDPLRGFAPGPHWRLPSPKPHVPTLPSNPGYATARDIGLPQLQDRNNVAFE